MNDVLRNVLSHGEDCPAPEVMIEAMAHGAPKHDEISSHVAGCPPCQTELALFRSFEAADFKPDEREAVDYIVRRMRGEQSRQAIPGSGWPVFWTRLSGFWNPVRVGGFATATAAVLLIIGLSTQWQTQRRLPERLPENDALRSTVINGVNPQGELAAIPDRIRWDPVPGAAEYSVTLSEVDRTVIFHKTFTSNVFALTPGRT
ncbi:MAG: hypothetical protein QOJ99_5900 [Bryobacterales bacterium]|nr:hypothetical protein [Bryobacterales bacterium]